jgi:hypothetical protein
MAATVHQLTPRQERRSIHSLEIRNESLMAERLHQVDQAQQATDEAWDRVMMGADGGEPDQMDVLTYEMAINDLLEAKAKAGL